MPFSERKLSWIIRLYTSFSCILLFSAQFSNAQTAYFTPAPDDISVLNSLATQTENNYQQEIAALPLKFKKEFKEVYKLRQENIKEKFDKKEIYASAVSNTYLQKIVQEIVVSNPVLANQNLHCFFSRSGVPNASYLGENLILLNMGLFVKLENESQLAFILSHEIAHCILRHNENSIYRYVTTINSEEVQHELRNIKKSQYNKRADLEKLLTGVTFNSRRHSRDHESQADSMAVVLLGNTHFDVAESLPALALLDTIDTDHLEMTEILPQYFDAPDYRFQKKWLHHEEGLLGGHAVLNENPLMADSLKTHPDCLTRIMYIQALVSKYPFSQQDHFFVDKVRFDYLKELFNYEIVAYAFTAENYSRSLFYTVALLKIKPSDPYLVTHTGILFNTFYNAQKKHTLGKLVDLPSPGYSTSYNVLLQFLSNLYLEDYANISFHYLKKYETKLQYYPPFLSVYNNSMELSKNE